MTTNDNAPPSPQCEEARKYNAAELEALGKKGHAFKNDDGSYSYPIDDADDLAKAIKAVGRGNADHDKIRKYIAGRANDLGKSADIPDNWNADGSITSANAASQTSFSQGGQAEADETRADLAEGGIVETPGLYIVGETGPEAVHVYAQTDADPHAIAAEVTKTSKRKRTQSLAERRSSLHRGTERRTITWDPAEAARSLGLEVRADSPAAQLSTDNVAQLVGYAIRYGTSYDVTDRYGTFSEEMRSGACESTLADGDDCIFLYDHAGLVMARRSSGTLALTEDPNGLAIEANLDTRQSLARDLAIAIERGDVHQMSVGFSVPDGGDQWNAAGDVRKISAIRLFDVSAVGMPASPTTSISLADDPQQARRMADSLVAQIKEHRMLSASQSDDLAASLDALHLVDDFALPVVVMALEAIDKALDEAQSAVSGVLGITDPDGDTDDQDPSLNDPSTADDKSEGRKRQGQLIALRRRRCGIQTAA